VDCHYSFLHENLLDMSHQYLHRRWLGAFQPELRQVDRGPECLRAIFSAAFAPRSVPAVLLPLLYPGAKDARPHDVPISGSVVVETRYPYQSIAFAASSSEEPFVKMWLAYTPVGRKEDKSQLTGLFIVKRPRLRFLYTLLKPVALTVLQAIFLEDKRMLEAEQCAYEQQGRSLNVGDPHLTQELQVLLQAQGLGP
jgi:hypothetical protein